MIGLIAPASPPIEAADIDRGIALIESLGFRVKPGVHVRKRWGFLAGTDQERAEDLQAMFLDPLVRAVFCVRGGHGITRLLPLLDFDVMRRNPKILLGFSDITALHCALLRKARLITFHGPHLASQFARVTPPVHVIRNLLDTLTSKRPPGSLCSYYPRCRETVEVLRGGAVRGRLIGGNLSMLCSLLGTPYEPPWRRAILCLEEINEAPYRVDRCLTSLLNAGRLQQAAGIAIGLCEACIDPKSAAGGEYRQSLYDVLRERLMPLNVPIVVGLPFGHVDDNLTLPLGAMATLDGGAGDLLLDSKFLTD